MQFVEIERERYSDKGEPPLGWGRYLEVVAAIGGLDADAREEQLAARGIEQDTWIRAESYWLLTLALDVQQGRTERTDALGQACADAPSRRDERGNPPSDALAPRTDGDALRGGGPEAPGANPAGAPALVLPPAPVTSMAPGPSTPEVPTFLQARELAQARAVVFAQATSMPVLPALPAIVNAPSPTTPGERGFSDTTRDGVPAYRSPVVPFVRAPSPDDAAWLPAPAKLPELTVVQHAMLSAELSVELDASRRADILSRYNIDGPAMLARIGAEWQPRLNSDARLAAQWRDSYSRHRATLQGHRR